MRQKDDEKEMMRQFQLSKGLPMNRLSDILSDKNDQEEFSRWAFGTNFNENSSLLEGMLYWNLYHSDKLKLEPDSVCEEDIPKMVEIWKKANRKSCLI